MVSISPDSVPTNEAAVHAVVRPSAAEGVSAAQAGAEMPQAAAVVYSAVAACNED